MRLVIYLHRNNYMSLDCEDEASVQSWIRQLEGILRGEVSDAVVTMRDASSLQCLTFKTEHLVAFGVYRVRQSAADRIAAAVEKSANEGDEWKGDDYE